MISNYRVISISHQTLDVNEIGQFVISHETKGQLYGILEDLKSQFKISELQYLSTCNRLEFLMYSAQEPDHEFLVGLFKKINPELSQTILDKIENFVTVYNGEQALSHVLEVASSLDSLVVGEREIFRQYRSSFHEANDEGLLGSRLRLLEKAVVVASKEVYSKTKIGEKSLSIVALAMEEVMRKSPSIDSRILLIGAGETNTLVMKFLKKKGFENITIFNRTLDNASKLSSTYGVAAAHLSELKEWNKGFDIIFACTGATQAVLTEDVYKVLINREQDQKLLIDLAVPRNIEAKIVEHYNTDYVSIDALRDIAQENLGTRKQEMGAARIIIRKHLTRFIQEYQQRQIQRVLNAVPKEVKAIKEKVLTQRYKKEIDKLDVETQDLIHEMVNYMEKSFVSVPMKLAKDSVVL